MSKIFHNYLAITALSAVLSSGSIFASSSVETEDNLALSEQNLVVKNKAPMKKCEDLSTCPTGPKNQKPKQQPCEHVVLLPSHPCPENWRFSGAFLYLLPTFDDTYFVLKSNTAPTSVVFPAGKRMHNDFGFKPGFRVGAELACCDKHREIQAFYSRLMSRQNETVRGSNLWATVGRPDLVEIFEGYSGSASSRLRMLYQRVDLNLSQQTVNNYGTYFYIKPGVEYAYLRLREHYLYHNNVNSNMGEVHQRSRMWGVGPQIGLGIDHNFYQGRLTCSSTQAFSITSLFSASILMGRGQTRNEQFLAGLTEQNVRDEHTWRTIPAFHARVGLDYLIRTTSKYGFGLQVGYEFNTYVRALARTVFPDDVAVGSCQTNYYNFDLQGLYVQGAFSF